MLIGKEDFIRDAVIIFDWDDTLMCSTAIKEGNIPSHSQLSLLECAVARLLVTAMGMGYTAIVTNASLPWVRSTAQNYLPAVVPLLDRVLVTSARQSYEEAFGNNPFAWKMQAFRDVVSTWASHGAARAWFQGTQFEEQHVRLTALGDSIVDIEAAESCSSSSTAVKTVKLTELPTIAELLGQLQVVQQNLPHIIEQGSPCSKTLVQGALTGWRMTDTDDEAQQAFMLF